MAATYDYKTRKMTRDFKFVQYRTKCKLSGLPTYVGYSESDRCKKCPYNGGTFSPITVGFQYHNWLNESYVMCKHPDAKDTENEEIRNVRYVFYEMLEYRALCALDG